MKKEMALEEMEMSGNESDMADEMVANYAPYALKQKVGNKKLANNFSIGNKFPLRPLESIYNDYNAIKRQIARLSQSRTNKKIFQSRKINRPSKRHYSDSSLPAVQAKGRLIELKSPFRIDLKSDDPALKIPVHSQLLKGDLIYFTIPKKDKRVFLRTKTINTTKLPLLAGAAQIFMDGDLVSKTQLRTTDEGSSFLVDLGVDKNIKTQRIVTKESRTEGLIMKEHITEVEVKIEIANSHGFSINLEIKDHYPLAPNDKIKVELLSVTPKPKYKKNGYLTWKNKVAAKEKKDFIFKYKVTHPEKYLVSEFN